MAAWVSISEYPANKISANANICNTFNKIVLIVTYLF
jgi:hypothetical protein